MLKLGVRILSRIYIYQYKYSLFYNTMVHNMGEFQNSTFDIYHTFNAKSSLTFILCSY